MVIRFLKDKSDIKQISQIHSTTLKNSLFSSLGEQFLYSFYSSLRRKKNVITFVAEENNKIVGFASGAMNLSSLISEVISQVWKNILIASFKNPLIVPKLFQTFFYPGFRNSTKTAEIFSLAVIPDYQGRGVGKNLVKRLAAEFKKKGYKSFFISVRSSIVEANNFYRKIGLKNEKTARFLGEKINFWVGKC